MNTFVTAAKPGFVMFYALLVSSLALAIGAAIFDITIREISLSAAATQSQYAVYAADTGAECALYWDNKYNTNQSAFATSSSSIVPTSGIVCDGIDIVATPWAITTTAAAATTTFSFIIPTLPINRCVTVQVAKAGNPAQTTIVSQGFNSCSPGALQLERVYQVTY